ncbi:Topoisomerase IV subunit A [Actinokineospora spheciospongiae]|uniref:DNA gyrase subunit A n=1 Tax=Actinokineospora spheciospongiae TaxID=909613 RepID=W7IJ06_9PSEU|nr:Topoisomerase IV subunit A [Actinokineospora spheciospongiae]
MARRKGPTTKVDPAAFDQAGAQVFDNPVKTEIEDSYLEYAYSVIHSRALPDARDGLKPVHRRILFSMNEQGYRPTHAYVKSSRVVGDCFVRGALVSTPAGLRPIEALEVGDLVLDGAGAPVPVVEVYENPVSDLVRLTWADGHTLVVTPGQRFMTPDGWVEARSLAGATTVPAAPRPPVRAEDTGTEYVLGLLTALGTVDADGRVLLSTPEVDAVDRAHGWAIGAGVAVCRDKREAAAPDGRDLHVLAFTPAEPVARPMTEALAGRVPEDVLSDRATWPRFLAGLTDGGLDPTGIACAATDPELHRQLRAMTAPTDPQPVVSVTPVTPATTHDIQVGSPDHAFVVEGHVVHNCMGKYHPHGDTAIYDAMVRLAQDFSLNAPLIDGHGNFGSPDDGPAASRYCVVGDTRIRLADGTSPRIADLADLAPDTEVEADFEVLDKDGKAVRVDRVFNSGVHPTLRLETDSGFSLRGSENHLVLCLEAPMGVPLFQWRRLDELTPGMVVCVARNAWQQVTPTAEERALGVRAAARVSADPASDEGIPESVWSGGWGIKRAFLMSLFEHGGAVQSAEGGVTVHCGTPGVRLGREVQELLAEFGVLARLRDHVRSDGSGEHRLTVSGLRDVRVFAERVGFPGAGQSGLDDLIRRSPAGPDEERVPFVGDFVRGAVEEDGRGGGESTRHDFDRVERWETERLRIIDRIEDPEVLATILPVLDSGYRFETVASVQAGVPEEVYSVRVVTEDHSFLAGGFVNHNTEARMSAEAMLLVGELGEDTVDFRPNYDGSLLEPTVLPAAFPNLLVNGTSGIAVGMATNMIPHNLGEVVAAARWLINHPTATLDKLMEFVPGPDLPTGGMLLGLDEVRKAYETGRGVVRMRAKVQIGPLEGSRGRQAITVTELPYQVGSEKIIEKITDEVTKSKRLTGIADVKDLTDRENGTRLVIECKVGVNPQALLADLYRLTPMEQSFGINNLVLVEGQPRTLGLKALLEVFLKHRYEVVTRRTQYRKRKREERLHLVEGLLRALIDIDKVIALIRSSADAAAAKSGLMSRFGLSEVQSTYILDTPLRRLTKFDKLELETEQDRLTAEIAELAKILDDDAVLRRVVSAELGRVAKDLTAERRTALIDGDLKEVLAASKPAGPLEVADDPCQVILSATGLVARTAAESEESSEARRRNGRARHDAVSAVVHSTARGQVLLVTNHGRAFKTDVLPLPVLPEQVGTVSLSGGMAAGELVPLVKGEKVVGIAPLGEQAAGSPGLALGTRQGVVKVCAPEWPVRSDEFEVISLKPGDEVVGATWLGDGTESLVFVSSEASLLRYAAGLVRPQGLKGGGMAGINLPANAHALFFGAVATADPTHGDPVVVTSTGQSVKVTPFAEYPAKGRATGGVRAHRFLKGETGLVLAWVGSRPAAAGKNGSAVELPAIEPRRDGSGAAHPGPDVVGHLIERD